MQSTVNSGAQDCGLAPAFLLSSSGNYRASREVRMGPTMSAFWVSWEGAEPRRLEFCDSSGGGTVISLGCAASVVGGRESYLDHCPSMLNAYWVLHEIIYMV